LKWIVVLACAGCASAKPHISGGPDNGDVLQALIALDTEVRANASVVGNTGVSYTSSGGFIIGILVLVLGLAHMWFSHKRAKRADIKTEAIAVAVQAEPTEA